MYAWLIETESDGVILYYAVAETKRLRGTTDTYRSHRMTRDPLQAQRYECEGFATRVIAHEKLPNAKAREHEFVDPNNQVERP